MDRTDPRQQRPRLPAPQRRRGNRARVIDLFDHGTQSSMRLRHPHRDRDERVHRLLRRRPSRHAREGRQHSGHELGDRNDTRANLPETVANAVYIA
ncbi:hypothetical protein Val02_82660 [Virgisporangium aliadipatigenens]|uniref:Uncharacterized protein n=1 Tax=Virgisporangium aliadipatigenens TaxID=741659 RepID=A0A8J3YX60_9ACTN|nr:hypothetical protein [Virgisporangium aliadipatigenens]GIJ51380.1 hypothetical protein Val02_82660 [Virgisporangium aliadipatigenens]